jgi:hypothetical protein
LRTNLTEDLMPISSNCVRVQTASHQLWHGRVVDGILLRAISTSPGPLVNGHSPQPTFIHRLAPSTTMSPPGSHTSSTSAADAIQALASLVHTRMLARAGSGSLQ